ncbi:hypothetical protein N7520_005034 [Penicillium odoratum]|uniref:uncharacterized protein n=1 Tax=Penicillium odoratum TaxID=1167516 RepID=UPI002548D1E5|nr:uncharacterized protein N7520_005034 [Penicillium odoratum]KAJ5765475.1 hypothetical protein N7520_005034 [Penicillium odoratum]
MSDNAHPGVRSLLAKFENSPSQVTSPPSRGRSPVSSDTPGSSRPLSKVRASFVTVDGVVQSNPGSPLRKISGRSDSPGMFGPKINEQAVEARRQSVASPTPGSLDDGQKGILDQMVSSIQPKSGSATTIHDQGEADAVSAVDNGPGKETLPVKTETGAVAPASAPAPTTSHALRTSEQPAQKTVKKRPSTINATRNTASNNKSSSTAKQPATTTKPPTAREIAKERANTLVNKPSRASLNPAAKATARTVRGSTPSQETSRTSPPNSAKSRARSPTRPVRLPASMTAPTQASAASAQTAIWLSSPTRPTHERPSSRASDAGSTKPANEGFLARMMRPTASSASKSHDRPESKAPQKSTTTKAPRPSMGRAPERGQAKAKSAALRPQTKKSQASNKESLPKKAKEDVKIPLPEQESEKENVEECTYVVPEEPEVVQLKDAMIGSPEVETKVKQEAALEPVEESVSKPVESTTVESSAEAPLEFAPEAAINEAPKGPAEQIEKVNAAEAPIEVSAEPKNEAHEVHTESPEEVFQTTTDSTPANEPATVVVEATITPEELEAPQSTEVAVDISDDKISEDEKDLVAEPSTKSEEELISSEPVYTEKSAPEAKQDVDEIDYVTLALN